MTRTPSCEPSRAPSSSATSSRWGSASSRSSLNRWNAYGIELLALNLAAVVPFVNAAGRGLRAQGVGYRRSVKVTQFIAGIVLIVTTIVASLDIAASDPRGLVVMAGVAVLSLIWGVFNTWELIFRVAKLG